MVNSSSKKRNYNIKKQYKLKNKSKTRKARKQPKKELQPKKEFKTLNCSPIADDKITDYSCYSKLDLHKLRQIWNSRHPDKPITTNNPQIIWALLKLYYSDICNKESCWVRQMVKDKKLEKELLDSFAPTSPTTWKKNPNEWLSSIDILQVMSQYEKKYKCFEFLGPSPINYDTIELNGSCVWNELCNFELKKHKANGKHKIGIIFNTDPHYKSGEHWISLFINCKSGIIFFFDSAGDSIPQELIKFVKTVQKQGEALNPPILFHFDQNYPIEHQYENTECGIYSIFFITHMLQDKINGDYLKTHILDDKYMQQFRKVYYNDEL